MYTQCVQFFQSSAALHTECFLGYGTVAQYRKTSYYAWIDNIVLKFNIKIVGMNLIKGACLSITMKIEIGENIQFET